MLRGSRKPTDIQRCPCRQKTRKACRINGQASKNPSITLRNVILSCVFTDAEMAVFRTGY